MRRRVLLSAVVLGLMIGGGLSEGWAAETAIERQVASGIDDAVMWGNGAGFSLTDDLTVGDIRRAPYGAALRFTSIGIPQRSRIVSAVLEVEASVTETGDYVRAYIDGEAADDSRSFSDVADYSSRPRTDDSVEWHQIQGWTKDRRYESPDIRSTIQEIVDRPGWRAGNSLTLFVNDHDTGYRGSKYKGTNYRRWHSYDTDPDRAARLKITYSDPHPSITRSYNSKTGDDARAVYVIPGEEVSFSITTDQSTTYTWFVDGVEQSGTGPELIGVSWDRAFNRFVSDGYSHMVYEIDPRTKNKTWQYGNPKNLFDPSLYPYVGYGIKPGTIYLSESVTPLKNGHVLIADYKNNRVIEVNAEKEIVWQYGNEENILYGGEGRGPNQLNKPHDAERLPDGSTLIADSRNDRILLVSKDKEVLWEYPSGDVQVEVMANGHFLISNFSSPGGGSGYVFEIDRFDKTDGPNGTVVWSYGTAGAGCGYNELRGPYYAAEASNGHILIVNNAMQQVIEIDKNDLTDGPQGTIVWRYGVCGAKGRSPGYLNNPESLEILSNGHALITDPGSGRPGTSSNERIIEIDKEDTSQHPNGTIVWQYGTYNTEGVGWNVVFGPTITVESTQFKFGEVKVKATNERGSDERTWVIVVNLEGETAVYERDQGGAVPTSYVLYPNVPNPFNPDTEIRYALPASGWVHLAVYDLLGQEVVTLVDGTREMGDHRVRWDGRDRTGREVASGLYFYRLQVGSYVRTLKMVRMK